MFIQIVSILKRAALRRFKGPRLIKLGKLGNLQLLAVGHLLAEGTDPIVSAVDAHLGRQFDQIDVASGVVPVMVRRQHRSQFDAQLLDQIQHLFHDQLNPIMFITQIFLLYLY